MPLGLRFGRRGRPLRPGDLSSRGARNHSLLLNQLFKQGLDQILELGV